MENVPMRQKIPFKFQFVAQSIDDIVGADIIRPAVQCCDFAENQCEYIRFYRAGGY